MNFNDFNCSMASVFMTAGLTLFFSGQCTLDFIKFSAGLSMVSIVRASVSRTTGLTLLRFSGQGKLDVIKFFDGISMISIVLGLRSSGQPVDFVTFFCARQA